MSIYGARSEWCTRASTRLPREEGHTHHYVLVQTMWAFVEDVVFYVVQKNKSLLTK